MNRRFETCRFGQQAWTFVTVLLLCGRKYHVSAGALAAYWGQNVNEGTLANACSSANYDIVMLSFLYQFGGGRIPALNLAGHCDPASGDCRKLVSEVSSCQAQGVQVILSLGGATGSYGFTNADEAKDLAQYLWNNFFGGSSSSSPLGAVHLDGIDLDIESGGSQHYTDLISTLQNIAKTNKYERKIFITAAPQCPFPDANLGPASDTALSSGLVDYVYVQFYNNYCQFDGGLAQMVTVWQQWTDALSDAQIFLGMPASPQAAGRGYVDAATLMSDILPSFKTAKNYGGVMLWDVFHDRTNNNYSGQIKGDV